jgi:hypothetical protein
MKYWHPVAIVATLALGGAPLAFGQSLAETAQKEKQRREAAKAAKPPATQTFSDEDLEAYAGERPASSDTGQEEAEATAKSAVPSAAGPPRKASETPEEAEQRQAAARKAEEERLRKSWQKAQGAVARAELRVKEAEDTLKTLPPGLPRGNYSQDILDAVDRQQAAREQALVMAKKDLAAAREYRDAVEIEARRKSIRLE